MATQTIIQEGLEGPATRPTFTKTTVLPNETRDIGSVRQGDAWLVGQPAFGNVTVPGPGTDPLGLLPSGGVPAPTGDPKKDVETVVQVGTDLKEDVETVIQTGADNLPTTPGQFFVPSTPASTVAPIYGPAPGTEEFALTPTRQEGTFRPTLYFPLYTVWVSDRGAYQVFSTRGQIVASGGPGTWYSDTVQERVKKQYGSGGSGLAPAELTGVVPVSSGANPAWISGLPDLPEVKKPGDLGVQFDPKKGWVALDPKTVLDKGPLGTTPDITQVGSDLSSSIGAVFVRNPTDAAADVALRTPSADPSARATTPWSSDLFKNIGTALEIGAKTGFEQATKLRLPSGGSTFDLSFGIGDAVANAVSGFLSGLQIPSFGAPKPDTDPLGIRKDAETVIGTVTTKTPAGISTLPGSPTGGISTLPGTGMGAGADIGGAIKGALGFLGIRW